MQGFFDNGLKLLMVCSIVVPMVIIYLAACQYLITDSHVIHHGNLRRRGMLNNLAEKVNVRKLTKVIRCKS